jgi:hypothetical protein
MILSEGFAEALNTDGMIHRGSSMDEYLFHYSSDQVQTSPSLEEFVLASRIVEVDSSGRKPIRLHHSAGSSGDSRQTPISVSSSKLKNSFMEQANTVKDNHNISKSVHMRASGVMRAIPIHPS